MPWDPLNPLQYDWSQYGPDLAAAVIEQAPTWNQIPPEFKDGSSSWWEDARRLLTGEIERPLFVKEGMDRSRLDHFVTALENSPYSDDPLHNVAAIAYLLSLCCEHRQS